jgi:hypothetical protein
VVLIDTALKTWVEFAGMGPCDQTVELYEKSLSATAGSFGLLGVGSDSILECGFVLADLMGFSASLAYFDVLMARVCETYSRANYEKLKMTVQAQVDLVMGHIKDLFNSFVTQVIDIHCIRALDRGKAPHSFTTELVTFLESKAIVLKDTLRPMDFQIVIESVAQCVSNRMCQVIVSVADIAWTPDRINGAYVNIQEIMGWKTLLNIPLARRQLEGLLKMFRYLLSKRLAQDTSAPQFLAKNRDLPWDAMVAILQRYSPKTDSELFVIPNNLVMSLIQRFQPLCTTKPSGGRR